MELYYQNDTLFCETGYIVMVEESEKFISPHKKHLEKIITTT